MNNSVIFLCFLYGNNDPSQTMSAALGLGVSAMAAVMLMKQNRTRSQFTPDSSQSASARAAETVVREEVIVKEEVDVDLWGEDLWGLTEEGEVQMQKASIPKSEEQSERVRRAKLAVQPMQVESLGTKGIGKTIPVIGRDMQPNTQPKVSGGCMFYMSDKYTQRLEDQQ